MKFNNHLNDTFLSLPLEGRGIQGEGETPQKRNHFLSIFFLFLLSPALVLATPQVPRTIVFQGILVDAGGNPLTDVPSANADISIVDGAGNIRYEEQLTITLYQGATAFLVGTGTSPDTGEPTGGIPLDVMEPGEGDLILKIKIEGQTIAQEDVILASVPFSFYSQYAAELTQPIESKQIKDGAITVSHLSEEVTTYVKSLGVSKEELEEHKTEKAAHTGRNISVENTFKNLMGTDLQMLMESVDYNITLANKASSQIADGAITSSKIEDGTITSTDIQDGTISSSDIGTGAISATNIADGSITGEKIADGSITTDDIKDGTISAADLDMNIFNGWDTNASDDLTSSTIFGGAIYGVYSNLQLADNSVNTNNIIDGAINTDDLADQSITTEKIADGSITAEKFATSYLDKSGDIVEGDLEVDGNLTVDGTATFNDEVLLPDIDPPTANYANGNSTVKAWGEVSNSGTLTYGYNVANVTPYGSKGMYVIEWNTDFESAEYALFVFPRNNIFSGTTKISDICYAGVNYKPGNQVTIYTFNSSGTLMDCNFYFMALGKQ